jgi:hypothetical protein
LKAVIKRATAPRPSACARIYGQLRVGVAVAVAVGTVRPTRLSVAGAKEAARGVG